jgi:heavy metal sensor kinase
MKQWWQRRSLKLRITVAFTGVAMGVFLGLTPVIYGLVDHRLRAEFDQQLQFDWNLVHAHLELDGAGGVRWRVESPGKLDSPAYSRTSFDVWSGERLLMSHGPIPRMKAARRPLPSEVEKDVFRTLAQDDGRPARALERSAQIGGRTMTLRVIRDESGMHETLREILFSFVLGVPIAALLSALGGYMMAGRTLKPITAMAERARQITSESLSQRLPNPNPHDELGQLATVFNQTLQRLQDSFDSLKRFTADASHELRTPLTALRTVGEVALRNANDPGALRETIGSMLEEAQRLNDLVDSLLLLARVESGRSAVHPEPVRLDELLADIRESVVVLATDKMQTLELGGDADVVATADPLLMRHAVMNILYNAIQHSPSGAKVLMRVYRDNGQAIIEIADNGPGIAPENHEKIFERFFRIDKARSRAEGGTGLGLAIAKLSVERQGGRIELDSIVGQGSRFRIVLPGEAQGQT